MTDQQHNPEQSFETLFQQHQPRILRLLWRLVGDGQEAQDLTQEVFLKLYYQPPANARQHHIGAWLYRVATNLGYNHIRSRNRRRQYQQLQARVDPQSLYAKSEDPAQLAERHDTQQQVQAALARLPQKQSRLLLLRQLGLSYNQLAESCGMAPGSVGQSLARAGRAFRQSYQQQNQE